MVNDPLDMPASGRFVGKEHRFPLRIYFEDTDLAGIVYYANYLRYMERARSDMMGLVGVDQRAEIERGGGAYVVADIRVKYRKPAKLDDALLIVTRVARVRPASSFIHHQVMRGDELLVEAEVTAAFIAADGRATRQPREWVALFEGYAGE